MRKDWHRWTPTQYFNVFRRKSRQVIIMDLIDAVVEGDDRPYFTCEHEEHLLVAVTHTHFFKSI